MWIFGDYFCILFFLKYLYSWITHFIDLLLQNKSKKKVVQIVEFEGSQIICEFFPLIIYFVFFINELLISEINQTKLNI